jgi:hypothetical protein
VKRQRLRRKSIAPRKKVAPRRKLVRPAGVETRVTKNPGSPLREEEVAALLREKLRDAGGGAFDVAEIAVRADGIYLRGEVPNERHRSLARRIVCAELGRDDVIDQLRVNADLWKRGEDEPRQGVDPEDGAL